MKKLIVCLFIAVAAIAPSSAQNGVTINEGIITDYFNVSIGDEDAQFDDESIIPAGEIASTREKIWNLWKSAVENYDEEKLIPLDILENRKSGSWELPSSLEPNAVMPYYYGCNEYTSYDADSKYPLFLYMHGQFNLVVKYISFDLVQCPALPLASCLIWGKYINALA